ncbi:hypothetical protein AM1BK_34300 [Neobacillus kokaensis]|uniref:Uncharacterized protein n=1 Tax=Neobacillus kokaensis TaxID=2759023 RepID=A0ABQ3N599_9BACI|nr:hypothetical protein AM1BK_34300 [Neobacillus kokaensis]
MGQSSAKIKETCPIEAAYVKKKAAFHPGKKINSLHLYPAFEHKILKDTMLTSQL